MVHALVKKSENVKFEKASRLELVELEVKRGKISAKKFNSGELLRLWFETIHKLTFGPNKGRSYEIPGGLLRQRYLPTVNPFVSFPISEFLSGTVPRNILIF